jgi:hypothetical protein
MDESNRWGISRYAALLAVLMLHLALLAALLIMPGTRSPPTSTADAVQLLYLPPVFLPKVRSENARPRRLSGDTAITIAPPVPDSLSPSASPAPAPSSDGSGSGVDWAAEARRALNAFEIRNRQPRSIKPAEDNWWPQAQHRAGERFKTANGDWIVWINANCYQVASSGLSAYAFGASLPQTVCPGQSGAAAAAGAAAGRPAPKEKVSPST